MTTPEKDGRGRDIGNIENDPPMMDSAMIFLKTPSGKNHNN